MDENNQPSALNQLLDVCSQAEAAELKVLHNAQIKCLKAYQEDPTAAKMRDWTAAKEGLQECLDRLWSIYMDPQSENVLKNRLEAVKWLQGKGYKIGKSKFYQDADQKRVRIRDDGSVLISELERYVKKLGLEPLSRETTLTAKEEQNQANYWQANYEYRKAQAKREELKLKKEEGSQIDNRVVVDELLDRARVLSMGMETFFSSSGPKLVDLVGGDEERVREIIAIVDGDEAKAQELVTWFHGRVSEVIEFMREQKKIWLDAYSTDAWYTEEMARAMEERQETGVRDQETGDRRQESGSRSQEPNV